MRVRVIALVAVLALGAAACGDPETTDDTARRPRVVVSPERQEMLAAAATTVESGTARTAMTLTMSSPGASPYGDVTISSDGVVDLERGNALMSTDMSSLFSAIPGVPSGLGPDDTTFEMRIVDGVIYQRFPDALLALDDAPATPWISIDMSGVLDAASLGAAGTSAQSNPSQGLDLLLGIGNDVEEVGTETIRGVETTHYRGVIDFGAMGDEVTEKLPPELRDRLDDLGVDMQEVYRDLGETPVDVWVDAQDRVRKLTTEMNYGEALGGASMTMTIEYFDFGTPVEVEPPPKDQVTDLLSTFDETMSSLG